jgi:hypothetical protein
VCIQAKGRRGTLWRRRRSSRRALAQLRVGRARDCTLLSAMIFQDDELDILLRGMHRQWRRARAVRGAGRSAVLGCILLLVACLIDYWLRPAYAIRVLLTLGVYGGILAHAWHSWLRHFLEPFSARRTAWRIEHNHPRLNEKLISAIELQEPPPNVSIVLVDWLRVDAQFDLAELDPRRSFPFRWHGLRVATAVILGIVLGMLLLPTRLGRGVPRVLLPSQSDATAGPFTLSIINPGDGIFHEGSRVSFVVHASDPGIRNVELHIDGKHSHVHPMRPSANTGHHSYLVPDLRSPFRYWAQAGSVRSAVYEVDVAQRPRVEGYQLSLAFPAYTGQAPVSTTRDNGDITALRGTVVTLQVSCSQPLRRLDCVYAGQTMRGTLSAAGRRASVKLTVDRSGDFAIRLTDLAGRTNQAIATIHALPDEKPAVQIDSPAADISANTDDAVSLAWSATDDFGVEAQQLLIAVNGRAAGPTQLLPAASRSLVLDLVPLALRVGDLVAVTLEVSDGAGQTASTQSLYIQIGNARRLRPALPFLQAIDALRESLNSADAALPNIGISLDHIRSMETASQIDREHHLATLSQRRDQLHEMLLAATQAARELHHNDLFSRAAATAAIIHAVLDEERLFRLPELGQGHDSGNVAGIRSVLQHAAQLAEALETRAHLHVVRHTFPLLASRLRELGDSPEQIAVTRQRAKRFAESANLDASMPEDPEALARRLGKLAAKAGLVLSDFQPIDEMTAPLLAQYRGTDVMLSNLAERLNSQPAAWTHVLALADEFRSRGKESEHDELFASVLADAAKLRRPGSIEALAKRLPLFESHQATLTLSRDIERFAEFANTRLGTAHARDAAEECRQFLERPLPLRRLSQSGAESVEALGDAISAAAGHLENAPAGDLEPLTHMRERAAALLSESRQRVQRTRRELLRYTEPPSVALRPRITQLRVIANRLARQPSLRQRHEAKAELATIVNSLERLAGDLTEATVTDLRDPQAQLLLACDRLALALHLRRHVQPLSEAGNTLDSAPGASAERIRSVASHLEEIAEFASRFEQAESGQLDAPESQATGVRIRAPVAEQLRLILTMAALQRERRALDHLAERIDSERPSEAIRSLARRVATLLNQDSQASLLAACGDTVLHAHDAAASLLNTLRELQRDGDFSNRRRSSIDNALALLDDATQSATHVLALFQLPHSALLPQVREIRDRYRKAAREEPVGATAEVIAGCKRLRSQLASAASALPARRLGVAEFASVSANVDPEAITIPLVALDDLMDSDDPGRIDAMLIYAAQVAEILAPSPTSVAEYASVIAQRLADNLQLEELASAARNIDALWQSVPTLATTHHLGYLGDAAPNPAPPPIPGWSQLPPHARLAVCRAFALKQVTPALASAIAAQDYSSAAAETNGPPRAAFLYASELIELAALSAVPASFAQAPEAAPSTLGVWPREAFFGAAIATAMSNEVALYHAKQQDFASAGKAMEALAVVHADPLPAQFAERGAAWFYAAESALAEFAFRGPPPADLPVPVALLLDRINAWRFGDTVTAYLAGEAQDAIYLRDYAGAASSLDAIAASPVPFATFAANGGEVLRLAHGNVYAGLSSGAIAGLQLLGGRFPEIEAALRYGNLQLAAVLARRHSLPMIASIFESEQTLAEPAGRAVGVLERGFASLGDLPIADLASTAREAIGRAALELAAAGGVLANPRGSRPRARGRLEAGARHMLMARELMARDILDTLLLRPKAELEDANVAVMFDEQLAPVVHGLDRHVESELDEAAADAHDTMGRQVDYPLFFRRANRRYLERLALESRKWHTR